MPIDQMTVSVPGEATRPIWVYDQNFENREMAVVSRECVENETLSGREWTKAGVYLLIDHHQDDETWGLYVGHSDNIGKRLKSQLRRQNWYRAVVVLRYRSPKSDFSTETSRWLEHRLFEVFSGKDSIRLHFGVSPPGNRRVSPGDRQLLEERVTAVSGVLRLIGHETDGSVKPLAEAEPKRASKSSAKSTVTPDKTAATSTKSPKQAKGKKRRHHGVKVGDLVSAGLIEEGDELESVAKNWPARARVGPGGSVIFDGERYDKLTTAAKAVTGRSKEHGWRFWAVRSALNPETLITLYQLRERFRGLEQRR